jgi:HEAT repeat protein
MDDDIKFLSEALSNSNTLVRRAALDALAENGSEQAVEAVGFALTDEELDVQLAAVRALGRIRGHDGSVVGITHLLDLVERSEDDEVVTTAIQALGDAADPRALSLLRPLVREGSAAQAVAAVEAFGRTAGPRRVDALIEALSHHESEVVKASLRELAVERAPRAVTHLGACLDHEAWDVRRLSADLLGRIGGEANVNLLRVKLATESEPLVREAIQRALDTAGVGRRTLAPPKLGSFR